MRKWLFGLLACAGVLAGIDTALWVWGTRALTQGVDRWAAQLRTQGWNVEMGNRALGGWPFAASVSLADIKLVGGEQAVPGGLAWHAQDVTLSVGMLAPRTIQIAPEGREFLRLSHMRALVFNADRLSAMVRLWGGAEQLADLEATGITGGIAGSHHPQDVRLEALALHVRAQKQDGGTYHATLEVAAHGIELPDIGRWPLGATVGEAGGKVDVDSPELAAGSASPAVQAASWRSQGGAVVVRDLSLHWGPLDLQGDAKLALDARLQPAGSGTADVRGGADALDALVVGGVVSPGLGTTAKAVLGAMEALPGGGAVRLPFVLRDSTLSVGPIPVVRLNDIVW